MKIETVADIGADGTLVDLKASHVAYVDSELAVGDSRSSHLRPPKEIEGFSPEELKALEKKLLRKVDWRLLPVSIVMYILKYAIPVVVMDLISNRDSSITLN